MTDTDTDRDTETEEMPDELEEGKLPPSDITRLSRIGMRSEELKGMGSEERIELIHEVLDHLSVAELVIVRDAAEARRLDKIEDAKAAFLEEMRARAQELGMSLADILPSHSDSGTRRTRRNAGQPLPVKYRGPWAKPGQGGDIRQNG
jgi:hypothetical protein